jgi:hypothetical protein
VPFFVPNGLIDQFYRRPVTGYGRRDQFGGYGRASMLTRSKYVTLSLCTFVNVNVSDSPLTFTVPLITSLDLSKNFDGATGTAVAP